MKKLKSIITNTYTLTLYEFDNGEYCTVKTIQNKEIPSLPTIDFNMANSIFDLWYNEFNNKLN